MSVVAVQAGSARLVGADRPNAAIDALAAGDHRQIGDAGDAPDPHRAPPTTTPSLDHADARASRTFPPSSPRWPKQASSSTCRSTANCEVPAGVGLAAYRITQEALTNVIKHAGHAHASVHVRYTDDDMLLEVRDDGTPAPTDTAGGHGLIGMRERAAVHGGELTAGPDPHGGFVVRARLPVNPAST